MVEVLLKILNVFGQKFYPSKFLRANTNGQFWTRDHKQGIPPPPPEVNFGVALPKTLNVCLGSLTLLYTGRLPFRFQIDGVVYESFSLLFLRAAGTTDWNISCLPLLLQTTRVHSQTLLCSTPGFNQDINVFRSYIFLW